MHFAEAPSAIDHNALTSAALFQSTYIFSHAGFSYFESEVAASRPDQHKQ